MGKHFQKKKKKNPNKDFQKVKLKPGRTLKKGTNDVSGFSLKSMKIQMLEQFGKFGSSSREPDDEFSHCLRELDHHNARAQLNALNKIRVFMDPTLGSEKWDAAIAKIFRLVSATNVDQQVRNQAMSLMKIMLKSLPPLQLKGSMEIVEKYTCLAMTHVNDEIRHDSLKLFEILLDICPEHICAFPKLVQMFWELITSGSHSDNVLRVMPVSEKISAREWRMYVLKLILKLLDINVSRLRNNENENCNEIEFPCLADSETCVIVNRMNKQRFASFRSDENVLVLYENEPRKLYEFLLNMIRVLIMTFDEACNHSSRSYFIDAGSMKDSNEFVQLIVKCLCTYAEWIYILGKTDRYKEMVRDIKDFASEAMLSSIFSSFPVMNEKANVSHTRSMILSNDKFIMLNLDLCEVFSLFVLNTAECSSIYVNRILMFLLSEIKSRDPVVVKKIFKVLKFFLLCHNVDKDVCEPHLKAFLDNSQRESKLNQYRQLVSGFFLDLCVDYNFLELRNSTAMKMWLQQFPSEFLAVVNNDHIDEEYLKKVMHIESAVLPTLLDGLQQVSSEYFDLLRSENKYVRTVAVIFLGNLKTVTDHDFRNLFTLSKDPSVPVRLIYQLMVRWEDQFENWRDPGFRLNSYKSFLLNIAVGIYLSSDDPIVELNKEVFCMVREAVPPPLYLFQIIPTLSKERHQELMNHAIHLLKNLNRKRDVSFSVQSIVSILLSRTDDYIPAFAAMAAVKLYYTFVKDSSSLKHDITSLSKKVNELTVDLLLYEIALIKAGFNDEDLEKYSVLKELSELSFDFGGIVDVMLSRLEFIENIADTSYYGTVLCEISERQIITPDDAAHLTALLKGLKTVFGRDILRQSWYERLVGQPAE